ncbi:20671_t:CDS:2 [Cetraspora pellucida]|uniref:20671_t:CDS:1 n=1 Tax=Cetraspora pellucida TaxID=1433469 RepID=A0A9N9C9M8_9GLOM|nr:20671_t:CDS:2 [Cetraspora pellucida]
MDEVKPLKKYQGLAIQKKKHSKIRERNVKCDNVFLFGHHLNEPKYKIVQDFYKYLAQDKSKPYYEDVTFSTLSPDKIPDPKKFNAKRSTLVIFEDLYSDLPAIQKKIISFFTRDIHENATHIVLFNGGGSIQKLADIISPYTDVDLQKASKIIDDTPLDLEKEIEELKDNKHSA